MICMHSCISREESYIVINMALPQYCAVIGNYCSTEHCSHIHVYVTTLGEGDNRRLEA